MIANSMLSEQAASIGKASAKQISSAFMQANG
jgi:hypothetical protein